LLLKESTSSDSILSIVLQNFLVTSQGLGEDLHTTSESEDQVEGGFFLDVVVSKSSAFIQLFTSEDESLLVWWDTFFVLDLGFDILDGVRWLNFESDGFTSQGLDEDLHTTSEWIWSYDVIYLNLD